MKHKTQTNRPLCRCGCGEPVGRSKALYARGCFDATTPENRARALAARDMVKFKITSAEVITRTMKRLKDTGELEKIRLQSKQTKGLKDHIAAKVWIIRSPYGVVHKFSNMDEWARQNKDLFEDTNPDAKAPFFLRIANGLRALLGTDGRSCSYKGWTAVSKLELDEGGTDLLGRDYFNP